MSNPQPQPSQPSGSTAPLTLAALEAYLIGLYVGAEAFLTGQITRILKRMQDSPLGALTAKQQIRQAALNVVRQLEQRTPPLVGQIVATASRDGGQGAGGGPGGNGGSHGGFLPPSPNPGFDPYELHGVRAANAIRDDLSSELQDVRFRLTRLDEDIYKIIAPAGGAGNVLPNGFTPQQAQAKAWREFTRRGITGFTDKSGRDWSLSAYTEMAVRTASMRAYNASRLQVLQYQAINLCTVSDTGHPCPLCFPWQGVVLAVTPDGEHPTVADATAAGLFHPNAILGDQGVRPLGEVENGVKAWYSGPSVNLTTARGHHLTVSPDHPVLTATGWLPAKLLREGMQIFSARTGDRVGDVPVPDVNLNHPESTFEHELDALASVGGRTFVPATADDLHGDGRFIEGEIEVVVADRRLLPVVETRSVKSASELDLVRADVEAALRSGAGSSLLSSLCVHGAVGRSLADAHTALSEASQHRRAADAETLPEILSGLAADVEPDELVGVKWDRYEGHAYDLQTSLGAYVAGSILVHNCRHTLAAYFPGFTTLPEPKQWTDAHSQAYKATQKQRALERDIRQAKRQALYALTPQTARDARGDIRDAQARLRQFLNDNPNLNLLRHSRREQIALSNATVNVLPYGG